MKAEAAVRSSTIGSSGPFADFVLLEIALRLDPMSLARLQATNTSIRGWCHLNDEVVWKPHCVSYFDVHSLDTDLPSTYGKVFADYACRYGRYAGFETPGQSVKPPRIFASLSRSLKMIKKRLPMSASVEKGYETEEALDRAIAEGLSVASSREHFPLSDAVAKQFVLPDVLRCLYRLANGQGEGDIRFNNICLVSPMFGGHVVYGVGTFSVFASLLESLTNCTFNEDVDAVEFPLVTTINRMQFDAWVDCSRSNGKIWFGSHILIEDRVEACPPYVGPDPPIPVIRWLEEYAQRLDAGYYGTQVIRQVSRQHSMEFEYMTLFPRKEEFPDKTRSRSFSSCVTQGIRCSFGAVAAVPCERYAYHLELELLSVEEQHAIWAANKKRGLDVPVFEPVRSAKLLTRHWIINGGTAFEQVVDGEGVVGLFPELKLTDTKPFEYESQTMIDHRLDKNTMGGWLLFERTDGDSDLIKVKVGEITFADDYVYARDGR